MQTPSRHQTEGESVQNFVQRNTHQLSVLDAYDDVQSSNVHEVLVEMFQKGVPTRRSSGLEFHTLEEAVVHVTDEYRTDRTFEILAARAKGGT